jgi:hypothetical protein
VARAEAHRELLELDEGRAVRLELRTMLLLKPVTIDTIAMTVATPTTMPSTVSDAPQLVRAAPRASRSARSRRSPGGDGKE